MNPSKCKEPCRRLTFKDGRGRNTILINGQEHHGQIADRLAAFEEMMNRWAFRKIEDIDTLCRRVNKLGGTDRMAEYQKADAEGRLIILPPVPDKDRQSVLDVYQDTRKEWIHDPSVGLFGPNENETALMEAIEKALAGGRAGT